MYDRAEKSCFLYLVSAPEKKCSTYYIFTIGDVFILLLCYRISPCTQGRFSIWTSLGHAQGQEVYSTGLIATASFMTTATLPFIRLWTLICYSVYLPSSTKEKHHLCNCNNISRSMSMHVGAIMGHLGHHRTRKTLWKTGHYLPSVIGSPVPRLPHKETTS